MNKFLLVFGIGCLIISNTNAQTQQDSIEAYKKVNKWAVVKLTIAYMEDLRGWSPEIKKGDVKGKLLSEFEDYIELEKNFEDYTESIDFDEFNSLLKDNWSETKDAVFEKYKIELYDSAIANNFEKILFVPRGTKTPNRSRAIEIINEKYTSLLPDPKIDVENGFSSESEPQKISVPNPINMESENESIIGSILSYLLFAISVLLNVFLFFKLRSLHNNNKKGKKDTYKDFYKIENVYLKKDNEKLKEEISQLKNEKFNNSNSGSSKERVITTIDNTIEDKKAEIIEFSTPKVEQTPTKLIYFPSPFENNKFTIEDVSETEKQSSLYVAEIDEESNRGIISLIETADLSRALNSPNTYLETVCDYENVYNSSAKGIKVMKDGEVVLEGDDWIVTKKIRIKFI